MIYLVLGPGRTGSVMLSRMVEHGLDLVYADMPNFTTKLECHFWIKSNINPAQDYVLHTHSKFICDVITPASTTLILSKRRNLFEIVMSEQVANCTRQWNTYTNIKPQPVTISKVQFIRRHQRLVEWYDSVDLNKDWSNVVELHYEDLVEQGHAIVKDKLAIEQYNQSAPITGKQSPHKYQDWISNWEELKELAESLSIPVN
jgi:LPS sulfotransferase NodH